ncbi:MAG: serine hydrolase domain-containing protein [Chloroflexota bacterium]
MTIAGSNQISGHDQTKQLDRVRDRIAAWVETGQINGAALAVGMEGRQVAAMSFGEAREGIPASEETLWPLASISKIYSAAMIMALVEAGELTLSLPAHTILPDFTGGGQEEILLRHLLTHTSGLIYESPAMEQRLKDLTPYEELIDEAYLYPLSFRPGSRISYSDYGIAIATRMAERVTGRDRDELIRELVFERAGLANTYFRLPEEEYDRLAYVVGPLAEGTDGAMYNTRYAIDLAHPSFGAIASVTDLLSFIMLFRPDSDRRIHSRATVRAMTTDQTGGHTPGGIGGFTELNQPMPWGLGFMLASPASFSPDLVAPGSFGHGGASGCTVWHDPVHDISVAFVSNKHAGTGRIPFTRRLVSTVNGVIASLTND